MFFQLSYLSMDKGNLHGYLGNGVLKGCNPAACYENV